MGYSKKLLLTKARTKTKTIKNLYYAIKKYLVIKKRWDEIEYKC